MNLPRPQGGVRGEPQLLPMINIVFLLLIFFMLVGLVSVPGEQDVTPPRSVAEQAGGRDAAQLLVRADGSAEFLGRRYADDAALAGAVAASGVAAIAVRADADVEAARLVALLAALREAGIARVRLLTRADRLRG